MTINAPDSKSNVDAVDGALRAISMPDWDHPVHQHDLECRLMREFYAVRRTAPISSAAAWWRRKALLIGAGLFLGIGGASFAGPGAYRAVQRILDHTSVSPPALMAPSAEHVSAAPTEEPGLVASPEAPFPLETGARNGPIIADADVHHPVTSVVAPDSTFAMSNPPISDIIQTPAMRRHSASPAFGSASKPPAASQIAPQHTTSSIPVFVGGTPLARPRSVPPAQPSSVLAVEDGSQRQSPADRTNQSRESSDHKLLSSPPQQIVLDHLTPFVETTKQIIPELRADTVQIVLDQDDLLTADESGSVATYSLELAPEPVTPELFERTEVVLTARLVSLIEVEPTPDWDGDGLLDTLDYISFADDYLRGKADFDKSGATTSDDFFAFTESYLTGELPEPKTTFLSNHTPDGHTIQLKVYTAIKDSVASPEPEPKSSDAAPAPNDIEIEFTSEGESSQTKP